MAAARELLRLGFGEHGRHRIFGTCDPRNLASAAVLRKIGMRYEGRMRGTAYIRDGWRDSELYAILVDDRAPAVTRTALAAPRRPPWGWAGRSRRSGRWARSRSRR